MEFRFVCRAERRTEALGVLRGSSAAVAVVFAALTSGAVTASTATSATAMWLPRGLGHYCASARGRVVLHGGRGGRDVGVRSFIVDNYVDARCELTFLLTVATYVHGLWLVRVCLGGESSGSCRVELDAQTAHEATAGAGDLRGIQRQPLIFGDTEIDGSQFRQPRTRTILAAATPNSIETLCFVANPDLFQLDARAKHRGALAHQVSEIDAFFGGEIKRQLLSIPLPFGVGDLHHQVIRLHALHCLATRVFVLCPHFGEAAYVVARRETPCLLGRSRLAETVGRASAAPFGQITERVDVAKIFAPIGVDDDGRLHRRRLVGLPEKELLTVTLE